MTRYDAQYWDHVRDLAKHEPRPGDAAADAERRRKHERYIVAKMIGTLEVLASSGILAEPLEGTVRQIAAEALATFSMPSKAERERSDA